MATIRISESDAARDFPGLLARVRAGAEVVIENGALPAIVLRAVPEASIRRLSESLRLAKEYGSGATLDSGFPTDLEVAVRSHTESLENLWD